MKQEERLLRAIGGADERLIEEALEVRVRKKPRVLRWVAVAACVCLLLASPVGASMVGGIIRELNGYHAPERYPTAAFSTEAKEAAEGIDGTVFYPTDTMEEAMAYAGLKHLENTVLENAEPRMVDTTTANGEHFTAAFETWMKGKDGEIWVSITEGWYTIDLSTVQVQYILNTDQSPSDGGFALDPEEMETREEYTTPGGMECVLHTLVDNEEVGIAECSGFAAKGDCLIHVTVSDPSHTIAMSTLKDILDAYG